MILKSAIRKCLTSLGYSIRSINKKGFISGIDLEQDLRIILQNNPNPILFDVGANVGQTISMFLGACPSARIFAFEPSPATFAQLQSSFGGRPNIKLENMALGDKNETSLFHVTGGVSVNDSLLQPVWANDANKVSVKVSTLDRYCAETGLTNIDHLKIDTQGYDLNVLKGDQSFLENKNIGTVLVEIMFTEMYKGQPSFSDILFFLLSRDYQLLGIYDQNYLENRLWYFNALFIRKK